jgi:uncharacterized radical SAM superfamily Fe-S cluster-containing enzyme
MRDRPYLFYELTNSVCGTCLRKVEAKVLIQDNRVYLQKHCPEHKAQRVLISTDAAYYQRCRHFLKASQMPDRFNTALEHGCPYDCGLCPDHEQHSCVTVLEVTDHCNLACPICYADSSPRRERHRSLDDITRMLDAVVANEGEPDVVQLSGGEPTMHPEFLTILKMAKERPIKHLMVNTNGVRLAREPALVEALEANKKGLEIYLQFDGLEERTLRELRGVDLRETRHKALEALNKANISTTLVVTLKKGLNDHTIGETLRFASQQRCVRGVTFQPIQDAGRAQGFNPETDRLTLAEVRQDILDQFPVFTDADVIPVPCHPDNLAMAYALKVGNELVPLTRLMPENLLLKELHSTIVYERLQGIQDHIYKLFSTAHSPDSSAVALKQLLCCLPAFPAPPVISYDNVFRVLIMQFLDAHNFDVRSAKKSCVTMVQPDGRTIPFDTFNMFYRDGLRPVFESARQPASRLAVVP